MSGDLPETIELLGCRLHLDRTSKTGLAYRGPRRSETVRVDRQGWRAETEFCSGPLRATPAAAVIAFEAVIESMALRLPVTVRAEIARW